MRLGVAISLLYVVGWVVTPAPASADAPSSSGCPAGPACTPSGPVTSQYTSPPEDHTSSTTSSLTIDSLTSASVTNQVNDYSTTLIAQIQGGAPLVDETLAISATDPGFLSAVQAAEAVLTSDGATSFSGPTLASSTFSSGSSVQTTTTLVSQSLSISSTVYDGPVTIYVGTNQFQALTLTTGQTDTDTLVTVTNNELATTTTTITDLLSQVYDINGTSVEPTSAPEIDPAGFVSGVTLLLGSLVVLRGRNRSASTRVPAANS